MKSKSIDITRDQSVIMRGMAIAIIMLHNYCHLMNFTVNGNDSSFSKDQAYLFFDKVTTLSDGWMYDVFSFIGWYGVPVFIFLTGFGLSRKYGNNETKPMDKHKFLYNNWIKLFALLLPAVLFFVGEDLYRYFLTGREWYLSDLIHNKLFLLTFLNDILIPWKGDNAGAYWYFGLTLEFYFLYAFFVYRRRDTLLLLLTLASVGLQIAVDKGMSGDSGHTLLWVRKNFTGWMVPFAFGVLYARMETAPHILVYTTVALSAVLFLPVMTDPLLWQVSLLCAVVLAIAAAKISSGIPYWCNFWIYIGRLSPFIFVSHPIVKGLFFANFDISEAPDGTILVAYVITVMFMSVIYKGVWEFLTPGLKACMARIISIPKHWKAKISGKT